MDKLNLSELEAKKPIAVDSRGNFLTLKDVEEKKPFMALAALDTGTQKDLVLKRNEMEPDYEIFIIGGEKITKAELMKEIKDETELGVDAVRAELSYLTDIQAELAGEALLEELPKTIEVEPWPPKEYQNIPKTLWPVLFRRFAVCAEDTDTTITKHAAAYRAKRVIPYLSNVGRITPIVLTGPNDIRPNFAAACLRRGVVYITGVGHGLPTLYTGYRSSRLWEECKYGRAEVKNKIIHLLSCQTAQRLGPDLVRKGACAYFGYIENFTITWSYPNVFWKCDSSIDLAFCRGLTAKEVTQVALWTYNGMIKKYRGIHGPTATWLTWDRDALRTPMMNRRYGNPKCSLEQALYLEELEAELAEVEIKDIERVEKSINTEKLLEEIMKD